MTFIMKVDTALSAMRWRHSDPLNWQATCRDAARL